MVAADSRGVAEEAKPFLGNNFKATLRALEDRMRNAAADLEFANELMTAPGETADKTAVKRVKAEARERFRKGRL